MTDTRVKYYIWVFFANIEEVSYKSISHTMCNFRIFIKIILCALCLWIIGHIGYSIVDGLTDTGASADVAVVFWNTVNPDGTLSTRLEKRLESGLNLYRTGRVQKLIVSGWFGKEGFLEGDVMRDYLVRNGVPEWAILVDNAWNNTLATVKNVLKLENSLQYKSIIVVSQYFHITWIKKLFRENGYTNVTSVSPKYFEIRDIYSLLREFIAYYVQ